VQAFARFSTPSDEIDDDGFSAMRIDDDQVPAELQIRRRRRCGSTDGPESREIRWYWLCFQAVAEAGEGPRDSWFRVDSRTMTDPAAAAMASRVPPPT